ncbi:hypothetical protein BX666DRAFT_1945616 [Dichotomocladium elegans]|nr:hypothetical protein BX666DRAFT_1945616 [Dichotomocladium elegans]
MVIDTRPLPSSLYVYTHARTPLETFLIYNPSLYAFSPPLHIYRSLYHCLSSSSTR